MSEKKRIYWADTLKGILIILVVLGHAISNFTMTAKVPFWNTLCDAIYAFHMPAFFVVSGYLQAVSSRVKEPSIRRKILSLGIPMIVFSVLYWLVKFVAAQLGGGIIANPQTISDLLLMFINPIGEYWFLYAILLISIVDICFSRKRVSLGIQATIWFVLLLAVQYISRELPFFRESVLSRVFRFGFYFLIGKVICLRMEEYLSKPAVIVSVTGVMVLSWVCWYAVEGYAGYAITKFVLASATTFFLIIIIPKNKPSLIGKLGRDSMDIYLLHPYFIVACKIVLTRFIPSVSLYFILATTISILLCYVAKIVISKIRYMDFVFRPLKYIK